MSWIRDEIKKEIGTIPKSVLTGGQQQAVRWKEKANKALQKARNPSCSEIELKDALEELRRFNQ